MSKIVLGPVGTLSPMTTGDPESHDFLTTGEVAGALLVSERRVRQLAEFLHAKRAEDGSLRFSRAVVEEYATKRQNGLEGRPGQTAQTALLTEILNELRGLRSDLARWREEASSADGD
jgi:hypothetical protein